MPWKPAEARPHATGPSPRTGDRLGVNRETLCNRVTRAEIDTGDCAGTTTDQPQHIAHLEIEVRELRRANATLR